MLPTPVLLGFPAGSDGEGYPRNMEDLGLISELGRSPGGGHGNLLQNSGLENPHGQRSLVDYSPWDGKESDTTEYLSTEQHSCKVGFVKFFFFLMWWCWFIH